MLPVFFEKIFQGKYMQEPHMKELILALIWVILKFSIIVTVKGD